MVEAKLNKKLIASQAGFITVHNYDEATREYLSSCVEYLAVGVGLPANSCVEIPGDKKAGSVLCRKPDDSAWHYLPDYRGQTVYSIETGEPKEITQPGDYPTGTTTAAPSTRFDVWNGSEWVTDSAAQQAAAVKEAEQTKSSLRSYANGFINEQQWPSRLALGRLSEEEKTAFNAWLDYLDALEAVDTSSAPEISWPAQPVE
ncbi:tail fiber assembly protein [Siccibacter turicensis]|uniref:Phage tail protein n=1 Tax=Siccibacter turicensis TaxID=357233 RepID=A0A2P8VE60_9ENTR|nr:tail fiber assembly protein [Siccibacter turicensis]PSN05834.1 phage tail protein [Siccibacter turicensis]